ncbi:hypothetical protein ACL7TT_14615 [Microbulbifer sp. 2304DJ12-6]|uniref:hypothetical protein n=1 Tax=Microbulbifer sp. 2304DJ12-6 TaxID=3233340 RepID=UPI0039B030DB
MAHVAKQLLDAVTAAVTGLPATGERVQQSRTYVHQSGPALNVRLGERRILGIRGNAFVDVEQDIFIDIAVAGPAETIDDQLLQIEAEVHRALMANPALELACFLDVNPGGLSGPELELAEKPKAVATSHWRYQLRHTLADPEH